MTPPKLPTTDELSEAAELLGRYMRGTQCGMLKIRVGHNDVLTVILEKGSVTELVGVED